MKRNVIQSAERKNCVDTGSLYMKDSLEKEKRKGSVKQTIADLSKLTLNDQLYKEGTECLNKQSFSGSLIIKEQLGKGGFGCVFDATYNNDAVIVKSSLTEDKNKYAIQEYKYLKRLQEGSFVGIPKIGSWFVDDGKQSFIMEKLGTDLRKMQKKTKEKRFSLETTFQIALKVLQILKCIHSCGILHNDIKPENLMTGLNNPNTIYLIDFGSATNYMKDGEHIPIGAIKDKFIGTLGFSSLKSLERRTLSRRDDLESLAYTLIKLGTGKLPFIIRGKKIGGKEKVKLLIEQKKKSSEEICAGMCREFVIFLDEVRKLTFEQKPQYDRYSRMFEKLLNQRGFEANGQMNWN